MLSNMQFLVDAAGPVSVTGSPIPFVLSSNLPRWSEKC